MAPEIDVHPVVQLIVNNLANTTIQSNWEAIVNGTTTRYSRSAGCQTAAEAVYAKFQGLGLNPVYQNSHLRPRAKRHRHHYRVHPSGEGHHHHRHLDDVPSSGAAPGADDNASGAATVTSSAQAMAGYTCLREHREIHCRHG